ncbi:MAG: bacteriohemerythrin [Eubacteriales bacterium]
MVFEWSKEIETGNRVIDREHAQLLRHLNAFLAACRKGDARDDIISTLQFLKQYTVSHFAHEEELQRQSGYPDYVRHKRLHSDFVQTVLDIEQKFLKEGCTIRLVCEINLEIGNWVMAHIKNEDKKIGQHIAKQEALRKQGL